MDSTLRPVLKRQLMVIGASLGAGLLFTFLFNSVLIGLAANIGVLVGLMFYIRWRQVKALRSLGFSDEVAGGGYGSGTRLKYVCLSCGAEVKGVKCRECGSKMKKPLF